LLKPSTIPWKRILSWSSSVQVPKSSDELPAATALVDAAVAVLVLARPLVAVVVFPDCAAVAVLELAAVVAVVLGAALLDSAVLPVVAWTEEAAPQAASNGSATIAAPASRNTSRRGS
jgi:hypothetical protein